jgi:hypothetical protein
MCVGLVILTGCAASPTTTVSRDDGTEVTLNWADYPGSADIDSEEILAAPRERDVKATERGLFSTIREDLDEQFDFEWVYSGEDGWYPSGENGYGGDSSLIVYNSRSLETDSVPSSVTDWQLIVDRASAVTEARGLGPVVLDHENPPAGIDETAWRRDFRERFGTDDPDKYWMWTGTAYRNSQWLAITIVDVNRDATGKAGDEFKDYPSAGQSVGFSYGATTIPDNERAEFLRALEPFEGLRKPPASQSD